jgi:hypothetical protein
MQNLDYGVDIIFRESCLLRVDFDRFAITLIRQDYNCKVVVSGPQENCLLDYIDFRECTDVSLCYFYSKGITFGDYLEGRAITHHYREIVPQRLWRFMKKVFPEYASVFSK